LRPKIKTGNDPTARARSIAVQRRKPYTARCIELELYALQARSETGSQGLGYGFLAGPQLEEAVALGAAAKTCKHLSFPCREIAAGDVERTRQIAPLLEIDSQRLPQSHRQDAAMSAVRQAEVETSGCRRRNQSRLAVPAAPEDELRRVGHPGIFGKDAPYDCVRLNEMRTKPLIREPRCVRGFVAIEKASKFRRAVLVLPEVRQPHMNLAVS